MTRGQNRIHGHVTPKKNRPIEIRESQDQTYMTPLAYNGHFQGGTSYHNPLFMPSNKRHGGQSVTPLLPIRVTFVESSGITDFTEGVKMQDFQDFSKSSKSSTYDSPAASGQSPHVSEPLESQRGHKNSQRPLTPTPNN